MILERVNLEDVDWQHLDGFADRSVYQTREWLAFIAQSQQAEPVVAEVRDGARAVGWFTGLVARRFGMRLLGSPLPGWTTGWMGFNLEPGVSRREATEALPDFAFGPLRCIHLEFRDRNLTLDDVVALGYEHTPWRGLEVDLRPAEEEIFGRMKSRCRTSIRRAEREGLVIEEARGIEFADECYAQMEDVFARQSLVPPYGPERLRTLIREVEPTGRLLLLRARAPDGAAAATGIFAGLNRSAHAVALTGLREYRKLNPNEALMWHAMRVLRQRGIEALDLGGFVDYKAKYGGEEVRLAFMRKSRWTALARLRNLAASAFEAQQRLRGRLRSGDPSRARDDRE